MANTPSQRPERLMYQLNRDDSEGIGPLATTLGGLAVVVLLVIGLVLWFAF